MFDQNVSDSSVVPLLDSASFARALRFARVD